MTPEGDSEGADMAERDAAASQGIVEITEIAVTAEEAEAAVMGAKTMSSLAEAEIGVISTDGEFNNTLLNT